MNDRDMKESAFDKAWEIYRTDFDENAPYEERTIKDIMGRLVKYGDITKKQKNFVVDLLKRIPEREKKAAERKKLAENRKPLKVGEVIEVCAEVVKTGWGTAYHYYSPAPKRVTMIDENYGMLWFQSSATCVDDIERGHKIHGTVTVKKVLDEIAFCSRPKVKIVNS
jgi:polyhydroxyalkanoate synthesis regulator phasin